MLGERTRQEDLPPGSLQPLQESEVVMLNRKFSGRGVHREATKLYWGGQGGFLEEMKRA